MLSSRLRQKTTKGEASMISRFRGIVLLAAGLFSIVPAGYAMAQAIARQVTLVVPYSAGGGTDTVARLIGNQMSRTLGQAIIIENVVGAGGTRANERVARSEPNGATVLINHVALLAAPSLFTNLRYDTEKDFEPGGVGTNSHLCGVMMGNVLGFKPSFVAYRGSAPAIGDLLAGQIDLLWDQVTNALPQVQSGMLHGIAITSTERLEELKDVPTTTELGMPEINYTMWHGLYVAKGTPKEIIALLNDALRKAVSDPDVAAKFKQLGTVPFPEKDQSPEAHARLFAADLPRVAKLVESSGARPSEAQ